MNVTLNLMNEHQLILRYINLIQHLVRLNDVPGRDRFIADHGQTIIDFIQKYADKYHHAKEENTLFRVMEEHQVLTHCNPITQMLYEHEQGRECVAGMVNSLSEADFNLFCENAAAYSILLQQHIFKEDNVLYPMAEECLEDDHKRLINDEYRATEQRINAQTNLNDLYERTLLQLENLLG